ncbi:MAG: PAS domain S-box protein [Desulfonatronovibrio sp.]
MKMKQDMQESRDLREQAEEQFSARDIPSLRDIRNMSAEEIQHVFQELHVHQIELDLQNQDLSSAREELEVSLERYFELYDLAPVGYLMVSVRGVILEANLAAADMLGTFRNNLTGQRFSRFICKKDEHAYYQHRKELFKSRSIGLTRSCELRMTRVDGTVFWALLEAAAIQNQDDSICCRVVISDIDKRKMAEEKLRQSQEQFKIMADGCPFMIWVHDHNGQLTFANRTHNDFFGTTLEDVRGNKWQPLMHPDDKDAYTREFMEALRERRSFAASTRVQRYDGQWRWIMSRGEPQFSASGKFQGMVGSSPDITDLVEAEERIVRINSQLKEALDERDKFFSIIAHDLRSPFIGFLSFIRMMTEKIEKFSLEEIQDLSLQMKQSAENLYNLLENLLEWSLLKRDAVEYNPVSCCLSEVVKENIQLINPCAARKDIVFENSMPDDVYVHADKSMLNLVCRNLFSNAVKFSSREGRVTVSADLEGSMVRVSVADEGMGMDRAALEKMFCIKHVSANPGTEGERGTGLGLVLCKEYIAKHGGEIWAESTPGRGTVFHFTVLRQK